MEKKYIILILLGSSAFLVGMIGMINNNKNLLPVAGVLFIATVIIYTTTLLKKK